MAARTPSSLQLKPLRGSLLSVVWISEIFLSLFARD
jgi:hypothetical protein